MLHRKTLVANQLNLDDFMSWVVARNPGEAEFHQAVHEVAADVLPFINANPIYADLKILQSMTDPDRVISFRVARRDDDGPVELNRGYRVPLNQSIGRYHAGFR